MQTNVGSVVTTEVGEAIPAGHSHRRAEPVAANAFENAVSTQTSDVILHVRFWPDTRVWEIAERPDHLDKEEWFKLLCARIGGNYQARAGGRGFFRLSRAQLEALKARNPN